MSTFDRIVFLDLPLKWTIPSYTCCIKESFKRFLNYLWRKFWTNLLLNKHILGDISLVVELYFTWNIGLQNLFRAPVEEKSLTAIELRNLYLGCRYSAGVFNDFCWCSLATWFLRRWNTGCKRVNLVLISILFWVMDLLHNLWESYSTIIDNIFSKDVNSVFSFAITKLNIPS